MKYHSIKWWLRAIKEQISLFVRNTVCREWLKVDFGYTFPDLLTQYTLENDVMLYNFILSKYPELRNLKKYLKLKMSFAVSDYLCASLFLYSHSKISTFWCTNTNLDDIKFLLKENIPLNITIKNVLDSPHQILVIGFDEKNIYFNDPLGDPGTKYKIYYGCNIKYKIEKFLSAAGPNIRLSFLLDSSDYQKINNVISYFKTENKKLFYFTPQDYDGTDLLCKDDKFTFIKYSTDGSITVNLGEVAKNKYIVGYCLCANNNLATISEFEKDNFNYIYYSLIRNNLYKR